MTFDTLCGNYNSCEEIEPGHSISYKLASAPNEDIDQPAHLISLIWVFEGILRVPKNPKHLQADSEVSDISKTYLYNFDPLKSHFNTVKMGFTGV